MFLQDCDMVGEIALHSNGGHDSTVYGYFIIAKGEFTNSSINLISTQKNIENLIKGGPIVCRWCHMDTILAGESGKNFRISNEIENLIKMSKVISKKKFRKKKNF